MRHTGKNKLSTFAFVLAVSDIQVHSAYFRDALGFNVEWPAASGWQLVWRDNVRVMIGHSPDVHTPASTGENHYFGYLRVDDADALHREFMQRGALILQPPTDKPHRMREFMVGTPDGHRLMIGQSLDA
jgi:predicted enzyme related to lactoylglutathione lyase